MSTISDIRSKLQEVIRNDGRIDDTEWSALEDLGSGGVDDIAEAKAKYARMLAQIKSAVNAGGPASPKVQQMDLEALLAEIESDSATAETLDAEFRAAADGAEKEVIKTKLEALKAKLKKFLARAAVLARNSGDSSGLKKAYYKAAGIPDADIPEHVRNQQSGQARGKVSLQAKAQSGGRAQARDVNQSAAQGKTVTFPTLKAQTGGPQLPTDAFIRSMQFDDFVSQSFQDVLNNQKKSREMQIMFAYYSQKAASGDIGQLYQFMKFLTYMITKAEALKAIRLGETVTYMTHQSNKIQEHYLNNKLKNVDHESPDASYLQTKYLTEMKSQTDAIATSQRLLAQSIEETTVVAEAWNSSTKVALDAYRNVMRRITS